MVETQGKSMRVTVVVALVAIIYTPVWAAMPVAEQNALVAKYCAVVIRIQP